MQRNENKEMADNGYVRFPHLSGVVRDKLYMSSVDPFEKRAKTFSVANYDKGVLAKNIVAFNYSANNGGVASFIDMEDNYIFLNRNNEIIATGKIEADEMRGFVLAEDMGTYFIENANKLHELETCVQVVFACIEGKSFSAVKFHQYDSVIKTAKSQQSIEDINNILKLVETIDYDLFLKLSSQTYEI